MIIFDTLQTALAQLSANKLRTGLTMLGIVIGVGAVIALMAAGQGAQQGVTKEVSGLGRLSRAAAPSGSKLPRSRPTTPTRSKVFRTWTR